MSVTNLNIGLVAHYLYVYEDDICEYILNEEYPENEEEGKAVREEFRKTVNELASIDVNAFSYLVSYLKANVDEIESSLTEAEDPLTDNDPSIQSIRETLDLL